MEPPARGSGNRRWASLELPPSKPISEKWLTRRRVTAICIANIAALAAVFALSYCGPPPPEPGSVTPNQLEAFSRLSEFRGDPLVPTGELMVKAQDWSEHMADEGRLSHSELSAGVTPGWTAVGENVAVASSLQEAQATLEASAPHRQNMLNPSFTEAGVGVVWRNGKFWVTQDFAGR